MARRLLDLRINEISLVDMPANKRRFAIIKRQKEKQMTELRKLIEAFLGKELDEEAVAKAELDPEVKKMLEAQLTLLEKYRKELPVDVSVAIGTLSQHAAFGIAKAEEEAADEDKDEDSEEDKDVEKDSDEEATLEDVIDGVVEKAGAKFSKDTQKVLESIIGKFNESIDALKEMIEQSNVNKNADEDEELDEETAKEMLKAAFGE